MIGVFWKLIKGKNYVFILFFLCGLYFKVNSWEGSVFLYGRIVVDKRTSDRMKSVIIL